MSTRPLKAVMRCTVKQINKLITLATKVIEGLTANGAVYPAPDPTVATLTTERNKLVDYQAAAKNGGKEATARRDGQAKKVFDMLAGKEILYVNFVAQGDKDKILLSGFDVNEQPKPKEVPVKMAIKSIVVGPVEHSVKINLAKFTNPAQITKDRFTFVVDMTTDPSREENWDEVLRTGNSRKLVIKNLVRKTEYFFRISAENTRGSGPWSDSASFVAQ